MYSYLWENPAKAKGMKNLGAAILKAIDKADQPPLTALIKAEKIDLDTYTGQLVNGDAGLDKKADLNGAPVE
jgi:hypothetical protein